MDSFLQYIFLVSFLRLQVDFDNVTFGGIAWLFEPYETSSFFFSVTSCEIVYFLNIQKITSKNNIAKLWTFFIN